MFHMGFKLSLRQLKIPRAQVKDAMGRNIFKDLPTGAPSGRNPFPKLKQ